MSDLLVSAEESLLVVIDLQPSFMLGVHDSDAVIDRARFLIEAANLLGVPVIATTQYATRMGGIDERLSTALESAHPVIDKMAFSCAGSEAFVKRLEKTDRVQAVVCGIETHICVCQTVLDLMALDYDVYVVGDAVTSRSEHACRLAIRRMSDAGAFITHSESCVYEWMRTAEHPRFRDILALVKSVPAS